MSTPTPFTLNAYVPHTSESVAHGQMNNAICGVNLGRVCRRSFPARGEALHIFRGNFQEPMYSTNVRPSDGWSRVLDGYLDWTLLSKDSYRMRV